MKGTNKMTASVSEIKFTHNKDKNKPKPDQIPNLPDSYVDCLLMHKEGHMRIGRLSYYRNCWLLSSYQACKHQYIWQFHDVVKWEVIKFHKGESNGGTTKSNSV